jgi:hypothetical protein
LGTDHRGDYDARTTEAILDETVTVIRSFGFAGGHVILIGGLVPGLLVPVLDPGMEPHVGTGDVDLCLSAALVAGEVGEYERLEHTLRKSGFAMFRRNESQPESWRWVGGNRHSVVIEFFCPATAAAPAGRLFRPGGVVGGKLSALALEAGRLLDRDNVERRVTANTPDGRIEIPIRVTGLAAFIATKVDAIEGRNKNKDAYDIVWLIDAWPGGIDPVVETIRKSPIWEAPEFKTTLSRLERQFASVDDVGPRQYARFMAGASPDAEAQHAASAVGAVVSGLRRTS